MITNAMSIDVEDYFQVAAFASTVSRNDWDLFECRVEKNIDRILELLSLNQVKATFFTLGWIAQRYPSVIKKIINEGHELASHGFYHVKATELTGQEFYQDVLSSKNFLEDLGGVRIRGYRAPSFSFNESNPWVFECLSKAGYVYSSSVYPINHDHYGMPNSPRFIHEIASGFYEIPITTIKILGRNFPASGGGYFRLFPYNFSKWMFGRVNRSENQPLIFYFHPWEIDPNQPRIDGASMKSRFRHYLNLNVMESRLNRLLKDFSWNRMDAVFL